MSTLKLQWTLDSACDSGWPKSKKHIPPLWISIWKCHKGNQLWKDVKQFLYVFLQWLERIALNFKTWFTKVVILWQTYDLIISTIPTAWMFSYFSNPYHPRMVYLPTLSWFFLGKSRQIYMNPMFSTEWLLTYNFEVTQLKHQGKQNVTHRRWTALPLVTPASQREHWPATELHDDSPKVVKMTRLEGQVSYFLLRQLCP